MGDIRAAFHANRFDGLQFDRTRNARPVADVHSIPPATIAMSLRGLPGRPLALRSTLRITDAKRFNTRHRPARPQGYSMRKHPLILAVILWTALVFIAYLGDVLMIAAFNLSGDGAFWNRLGRRLGGEALYGLRPLLALAGYAGLLYTGGVAALLTGRARFFRHTAAAVTSVLIFWHFARTAMFHYMRIDIDPGMAVYAVVELPHMLAGEFGVTVSSIPWWITAFFAVLFVLAAASSWLVQRFLTFDAAATISGKPVLLGGVACAALAGPVVAAALPGDAAQINPRAHETAVIQLPDGPGPFPPASELQPQLHEPASYFERRFGFSLPKNTNVVFIILESARDAFVNLEVSEHFREDAPETLVVEHAFVPVPHSSNSHFSLFTGLHSKRDFEEKYKNMDAEPTLPKLLEKRGYVNYFVYTDHTAFEDENIMLDRLNMFVTEKKDFTARQNPDTGKPYESFHFGLDDIALAHEAAEIAERHKDGQRPFSLTLVMTNSHYPYLNPRPEEFNRHPNNLAVGRHRNGVDYGLHVADRVVDEFRKRALDRDTLFVLLSDHGESFGERGFFRHSFSIYNEEVKVKIAFRHPSFSRLRHEQDNDPAFLKYGTVLDIFPTVFDMLGYRPRTPLHGRSLFDPKYQLNTPLWVWRLDDFRGYIAGETKWIYNSVDGEIYKLDLHDKVEETYRDFENYREGDDIELGYALAFARALMNLDYGKAGGLAVAAGSRPGPWIDPAGPMAFGMAFSGGGARFVFDCDELEEQEKPLRCLPAEKRTEIEAAAKKVGEDDARSAYEKPAPGERKRIDYLLP